MVVTTDPVPGTPRGEGDPLYPPLSERFPVEGSYRELPGLARLSGGDAALFGLRPRPNCCRKDPATDPLFVSMGACSGRASRRRCDDDAAFGFEGCRDCTDSNRSAIAACHQIHRRIRSGLQTETNPEIV